MKQNKQPAEMKCSKCGRKPRRAPDQELCEQCYKKTLRIQVDFSIVKSKRKFYLIPPDPERNRPSYYVRFDVPRSLRKDYPELPATVSQSTGTGQLNAAKLRAKQIIESVFKGETAEREQMKIAQESYCSLGEFLAAYKPSRRDCSEATERGNKAQLRLLVREATGATGDVDAIKTDVALNAEKWFAWKRDRMKKATALGDPTAEESAIWTMNSVIRQARSVFGKKVTHCFKNLRLPNLELLKAVRPEKVQTNCAYDPIPPAILSAMERDAALLATGNSPAAAKAGLTSEIQKQVYRVYLMMSGLGMRNSEVFNARELWIERYAQPRMAIKLRVDWKGPKNKRGRNVPMAGEILAALGECKNPTDYLIDAPTDHTRWEICYRHANAWIRDFLPDRGKGMYEMRKHAGSIVYNRDGIEAAAAFLGDTVTVAMKHYCSHTGTLAPITRAEIAPLRKAA